MSLGEVQRFTIPIEQPVRSLCWDGDFLVDWAGGGIRYSLEGRSSRLRKIYYPYRFDRAVILPNTEYTILYEVLGTKGLVLKNGEQVREINRSYYFANAFEFPVTALLLPDGTPGTRALS